MKDGAINQVPHRLPQFPILQNIAPCFYVLNIGCENAIVMRDFSERQIACHAGETVSITHRMLPTGKEWRLEGVGLMACRVECVFMSSIYVRTSDSRVRLERLNEGPTNHIPHRFPEVPIRQNTAPAGRDREHNSLYAIHTIGMKVGRW